MTEETATATSTVVRIRADAVGLVRGVREVDVRRRGATVFAAATFVLLLVARRGAPSALFVLALAAFAVSATLWVRGQYRVFLTRAEGEHLVRSATYLLVMLAAVGCAAWYAASRGDEPIGGLLVGALMLFYFAVGGLLSWWRERRGSLLLTVAGLVFAVLSLAGVYVGYRVLAHGRTGLLMTGVLLLAAGLLVCWPLAVAQLSEAGTRFFARPGLDGWRAVVWVVGLGGAVGVGFVIWSTTGSFFTVAAMAVLGVLIAAVASSTRADIVLVIAVLAAMGFTPGAANPPRSLQPETGDRVLVALGDSYMSGEGASIYFDGTDTAGEDQCRRAPSAWAVQAGRLPPFDGTVFLACSGAVSANVRTGSYPDDGLREPFAQLGEGQPQLAQYTDRLAAEGFTPGLVVISLGGNDSGFSTIGVMCLAPGSCQTKQSWWTGGLSYVGAALDRTFDEVRRTFPDTPVVVTAYPDPIYRGLGDPSLAAGEKQVKRCGQVALTDGEKVFVGGFLNQLNATVEAVTREHRFYYLAEMQDSLKDAGLQLCDPTNDGRPGLNFIGLRSVSGLAEQRFNPANWSHNSLHPNERGHQAMLQTFERWYAENAPDGVLAPEAPLPSDQPLVEDEPAARTLAAGRAPVPDDFAPLCSPLDPAPTGCRSRGTHWAAQETAGALGSHRFVAMSVGLVLLWLGVLAFFGGRRRAWQSGVSVRATPSTAPPPAEP